jgi:hypothetical protein
MNEITILAFAFCEVENILESDSFVCVRGVSRAFDVLKHDYWTFHNFYQRVLVKSRQDSLAKKTKNQKPKNQNPNK